MSPPIEYEKIAESRSFLDSSQSASDEDDGELRFYMRRRGSTIPATVHWILDAILMAALLIISIAFVYRTSQSHESCVRNENAWFGMIRITESDVLKLGKNLSAAQFPPEVGGGYIGAVTGTHQLHCLHYIWQDHHISYFPEMQETQRTIPKMYERHYEHCVDYIRQSLMCNFDPQILTYNWVRSHQSPTPNGNTMHKCVDWSAVQKTLKKDAVELPDDFRWHQPADAQPWNENP
ncbi:MAG: hypothetical protein Q9162_005494 [Coniocarpon cinnabarinum]